MVSVALRGPGKRGTPGSRLRAGVDTSEDKVPVVICIVVCLLFCVRFICCYFIDFRKTRCFARRLALSPGSLISGSGACECGGTPVPFEILRPVRLLRVWISEGLTQADS